jgi:hypothetical protein
MKKEDGTRPVKNRDVRSQERRTRGADSIDICYRLGGFFFSLARLTFLAARNGS